MKEKVVSVMVMPVLVGFRVRTSYKSPNIHADDYGFSTLKEVTEYIEELLS